MFGNLVKTGFEVKRVTKEGKEQLIYNWSPVTFKKYGEFVRWVQYRPYHDALQNNLPKKIIDEILIDCRKGLVTEKVPPDDWILDKEAVNYKELKEEDLVEKEIDINITSTIVIEYFTNSEGLAKLLQLGISINHSEVTEEVLDKEVNFKEQVSAIAEMQELMFKSPEKDSKKKENLNQ